MASPTAKRPARQTPPKAQVEVIDPRWLLKALVLALGAAVIFAYLSVCLLIYQGGWQLLLHPSAKIEGTPSIPYQLIRFDAASSGKPRLTGWWIPAEAGPVAAPARTVLYLHDGFGSLSSSVRKLELLHRAGVNVFAIDYRGYGQSDPPHPTEARMAEDSTAALDYLVNTRHLDPGRLIPYGEGLGAVLAANLAHSHPGLPAVIIDTPDPDAFPRAMANGKARLLPMHVLVQERFDLRTALMDPKPPKLLLADGPFGFEAARVRENQALFRTVPGPKISVTFDNPQSADAYLQSLTRFLDEYVPQ